MSCLEKVPSFKSRHFFEVSDTGDASFYLQKFKSNTKMADNLSGVTINLMGY